MPRFTAPKGHQLAYEHHPGGGPGVFFCGGFRSDMSGIKALALEAHCRARGQQFTRFDYSGHGQSSGRFEDGCIGDWATDAIAMFDALTKGPQIIVGSSMGAWIALLLIRARAARITGLLTVAAAADFIEDVIWAEMSHAERDELREHGVCLRDNDYAPEDPHPITQRLVEDARQHLQLRAPIAYFGPARLLHGMQDTDIPWSTSLRLAELLGGEDVRLTLIKDGEHRLSRRQDLSAICALLNELNELTIDESRIAFTARQNCAQCRQNVALPR